MATYFWVAEKDAEWGSASSWSFINGGSGGAGVPGAGDNAIITGSGNKTGGIRLTANVLALNSLFVSSGFFGIFNFDGYSITATGSISFGTGVILIGLAGVSVTSSGANIFIGGNPSALRNLQAHSGAFTLNAATTINVEYSKLKNVAATAPSAKALNCFNHGGCSGLIFDQEVGTNLNVLLSDLANEGEWNQPLSLPPYTGEVVDYWDQDKFKLTVGGSLIDFRTNSKYKLLDFSASYDGKELRFTQVGTPSHASADFDPDDLVTLEMDLGYGLETFFRGRIRRRTHSGVNNAEEIEYSCVGMQNLAEEVDFVGRDGMPGDVYPGYVFTAGQIVSQLFTNNATHLGSLSIPTAINTIALATLTNVVRENMNVEGSGFTSALRNILKEQPSKKVFFDDVLNAWSFPDLLTPQTYDLSIDLVSLEKNEYTLDLSGRYTAIECYAPFSSSGVTAQRAFTELTPSWDPDFEADWTIRKALGADGAPEFASSYAWVFRRWTFGTGGNSTQRYKPARMYCLIPWWKDFTWVPIDCMIDWQNSTVVSKVPIVVKGNPHVPGDAIGPYSAVLTYWDPQSYPVSNLAFTRVPATGFEGSAYTKFGVQRVKRQMVDVNQLFTGYAQDRLNVLKDVVVTADLPIKGDPMREFINLQATVRVIDSTRITGMEDFYGMVVGYKYAFGKPGTNTITITTDKSIVSRAN